MCDKKHQKGLDSQEEQTEAETLGRGLGKAFHEIAVMEADSELISDHSLC